MDLTVPVTPTELPGPTVRPMAPEDDLDALNAGNPMGWMAPWWRELDSGEEPVITWFTGLLDGRPAGFAAACPLPFAQGGNGVGIVHVLPEARRRGLGTALLRAVAEVVCAALPAVRLSHLEGDADAEAAVAAWGLAEVARHQESVLDLTAVDRDAFAARCAVPGVELALLPDLARMGEEDWTRLHAFVSARLAEAPDSADGGGVLPVEMFRSMVTEPWMLATATRDGEWVGVTCVVRRPGTTDVANTFFTGVLERARGHGVASALKCFHALAMADLGIRRLHTQNMEGNAPILAANRTLGFVRDSGYVDVVRPRD